MKSLPILLAVCSDAVGIRSPACAGRLRHDHAEPAGGSRCAYGAECAYSDGHRARRPCRVPLRKRLAADPVQVDERDTKYFEDIYQNSQPWPGRPSPASASGS